MDVGSGEVAVALDEFRASRAAPGPARLALHVGEGGLNCLAVGGFDLDGDVGSTEAPKKRDGLRSREGEIEAGNRAAGRDAARSQQRFAVYRVAAGEHGDELVLANLAFEAEASGGVADPLACLLALAGVVVLSAFSDFLEVVALLSFAEQSIPPLLSRAGTFCIGSPREVMRRKGGGC